MNKDNMELWGAVIGLILTVIIEGLLGNYVWNLIAVRIFGLPSLGVMNSILVVELFRYTFGGNKDVQKVKIEK